MPITGKSENVINIQIKVLHFFFLSLSKLTRFYVKILMRTQTAQIVNSFSNIHSTTDYSQLVSRFLSVKKKKSFSIYIKPYGKWIKLQFEWIFGVIFFIVIISSVWRKPLTFHRCFLFLLFTFNLFDDTN